MAGTDKMTWRQGVDREPPSAFWHSIQKGACARRPGGSHQNSGDAHHDWRQAMAGPKFTANSGATALAVAAFLQCVALPLAMGPALGQTPDVIAGKSPGFDVIALHEGGVAKALAALPGAVREVMARSHVPGVAVAVVHKGRTIYAEGFGVRETGKDAPVTPATVFQIASMSKPVSATITAIEATKGRVSWDDPVRRHLPDFRVSNAYVTANATIGDFFAHRSGLPHAAGDALEDLGFSRKEILPRLAQWPLDPFRISYNYANFGTTTAAEAVAAAAGQDWETLAEQVLYRPLGMTSTSSRHADFIARKDRARLHALKDGAFRALYDRNPDAQSPAGGVSSNVLDLAEWTRLLLGGGLHGGKRLFAEQQLLPALAVQAFTRRPSSPDERGSFYGYGFNVDVNANGRTSFGHSGAFVLGAATCFQILPSADIGIIVLTNASPVGAAEAIVSQFMDIVQYGVATRDWYEGYHKLMAAYFQPVGDLAGATRPASPAPAQPLAAYTGAYANSYYGPVEIVAANGGLKLLIGPQRQTMPLAHWSGDTFAMEPSGENAPDGSRSSVRFSMGKGAATGLIIDYLNRDDLGVWRR